MLFLVFGLTLISKTMDFASNHDSLKINELEKLVKNIVILESEWLFQRN